MRAVVFSVLAVIMLLAAIAVFLFSCWATASDAQGAIVFLFLGPVILVLLGLALVLGLQVRNSSAAFGNGVCGFSIAGFAFFMAFVVSAFVPGLRAFPDGVAGGVAAAYEWITGESPYETVRKGHDVPAMISAELARTRGAKLDLGSLPTSKPWDRVCVFGPYTDNAAAAPVLGLQGWDIEMYSKIASSDAIATLVFIDGERVSYVVEQPRGEADLAKLSRRCFARDAAVFEHVPAGGGGAEFAPGI